MDGRSTEYSQSDQSSAAPYPPSQDPRSATSSTFATPPSEYSVHPSSARSSTFPEYGHQRPYADHRYSTGSQSGGTGSNMAQATSPSHLPPADGRHHPHPLHPHPSSHQHRSPSDADVPIDPSIAASSPTYAQHQQYSPYPPQHDMSHYPGHPGTPSMYQRPDWAGYPPQPPQMTPHYAHSPSSSTPGGPGGMVSPVQRPPNGGHPLSTVYSFVPIPGAQQHKRPRRRYEEIERMYKCGWNGCEKAYGTLNHLNAHVTMQSHGTKRTPEEFKEIRKEWKAKKKEEEQARKADDERVRAEQRRAGNDPQPPNSAGYPPPHMVQGGNTQLPPIGYAPAGNQPPTPYSASSEVPGSSQYSQPPMYNSSFPPHSPYGAQPNQMS